MSRQRTSRPRGPVVALKVVGILVAWSVLWGFTPTDPFTKPTVLQTRLDGATEVRNQVAGAVLRLIPPDAPGRAEALLPPVAEPPGWPVWADRAVDASPAVMDLDGDGSPEVSFASYDGRVYAVRADGSPLAGWPVGNEFSRLGVALGRFTDRELPHVVSGAVSRASVLAMLGAWDYGGLAAPGWPVSFTTNEFLAPPTLADLDLDGALEALASPLGSQHALRSDGTPLPGWPVAMDPGYAFSIRPAAVGDVTGDGRPEVFVGAQDQKLYGWDSRGQRLPGFPIPFSGRLMGGPSLADFDGDGVLEIGLTTDRAQVWLLEPNGTPLPGWPQQMCCITNAGLAVGDVDGDGALEIASATINSEADFTARVYLWGRDGTLRQGWPREAFAFGFSATPTLADVDGDGLADVIAGGATASFTPTGRIYAWRHDGTLVPGFPIGLPGGQSIELSTVTADDLDQDGFLDLLVGSHYGLVVSAPGQVHAFPLDAPYDPTTLHWPTEGHDYQRTSRYTPPPRKVAVQVVPSSLELDHAPGLITVRVTLPENLTHLAPEFLLTAVQGRPVSMVGRCVGPGPGSRLRIVQFAGPDLVSLIRATLDPVPSSVRLDFSAATQPALHGFTNVTAR